MTHTVFFTSDTHVQNSSIFAQPLEEGITTRAEIAFGFLRWLKDFAFEHKASAILHGGDLFSQKNVVPVPLFNKTYDIFREICAETRVVAIPGNHDRYMNAANVHTLHAFAEIENFTVCSKPEVVRLFDNVELIGIPAGCREAFDLPARDKRTRYRILMLHENIVGAQFESGARAEAGIAAEPLFEFVERDKIDLVLCGDIHRPQVLRHPSKKKKLICVRNMLHLSLATLERDIVFCGAPYQMDFGDAGQNRGVVMIDFDKGLLGFFDYPNGPNYVVVTDETFETHVPSPVEYTSYKLSKLAYIERASEYASVKSGTAIIDPVAPATSSVLLSNPLEADYEALVEQFVIEQTLDDSLDALRLAKIGREYVEKALERTS
jgi:DNA repair exonuclease SbcCD nuclease subunit